MENFFLHLLNMSLTAGVLVVVVMLLRVVFHKAPRWIHCLLWALVAVRLLCPFTIESHLSLMPDTPAVSLPAPAPDAPPVADTPVMTPVPDTPTVTPPAVDTPPMTVIPPVTDTPSAPDASLSAPTPEESADPWQIALTVAAYAWLAGVVMLAAYALFTTLRLRRQVGEAAHLEGNLWQCDHIRSPFILGVFRPRIYLPSDLSGGAWDSVVAHEQAHLHRRDHWWKPLGFLLLTVYWFNPLMWVAYIFLCRDIEAACDERVVRNMNAADRKAYSEALLSCSAPRRLVSACPLAFGETSVKSRIKSVLSYKKPTIWIIVAALLVSTVAGVCLLTNRPADKPDSDDSPSLTDKDDDPDPDDTPQYAFFTHKDKPHAQVTLEIGGNSCTYTNSIASSWLALGTYTMDGDTVTLNFPDDAMTLVFKGDLIGLTLRIGNGGSRMSYEQMSFGDDTLKNGAVFERQEETRAVSFDASVTFAGGQVRLTDEQRTALYERYSYRSGSYSDKDRPVIPITSRAELEAFTGEYIAESKADLVSGYDDAFFADKMLFAVYHRDGSGSVQPKIEAIDYNGTELVTVRVDVYEPTWCDTAIGQWFMLAEVPRSEIKGATAYRAVVRNRIPTDNYWITYSHPIVVGSEDEPTKNYHRLGDLTDSFRQRLDGLTWYGADTMADTAFTALGHFSFDGKKQYYVSPDGKQLYDGEQIADLSDEDGMEPAFGEGAPLEAATATVTGMMVEWNQKEQYMVFDVTDGDSKLGKRVRAYAALLSAGSAPAVGYPVTVYYDGWYQPCDEYSVIYAIHRVGLDADLVGGPDDEPTTSTTGTTTAATTAKPTAPAKVTFVEFSRPNTTPYAFEDYSLTQYMSPIQPDAAICEWLRTFASRTGWFKKETYVGAYDAYFTIGEDENYYYIDRVNQVIHHNRRFLSLTKEELSKLDALIRGCDLVQYSRPALIGSTVDWEAITGTVQEYVKGEDGYILLKVDYQFRDRFGETVKVSTRFMPQPTISAANSAICVVYDGEYIGDPGTLDRKTIYAHDVDILSEDTIVSTGIPLYDDLLRQIQTHFYDRSTAAPDCSAQIFENPSALVDVGIKLIDLDNNGQKELVIAGTGVSSMWSMGLLYDVYTIQNQQLVHILCSTEFGDYDICRGFYIVADRTESMLKWSEKYYRVENGQLVFVEGVAFDVEYAKSVGLPSDDAFFRIVMQDGVEMYEPITEAQSEDISKSYVHNDGTFRIDGIPFSL